MHEAERLHQINNLARHEGSELRNRAVGPDNLIENINPGGFSTCELSDALIKLGVPNGGYIADMEAMSPIPFVGILSGPAFTVKIVDGKNAEAPRLQGHFVDRIEPGTVVVIDAPYCLYFEATQKVLLRFSGWKADEL